MNKLLIVIIALLFMAGFIGWLVPMSDSLTLYADRLIVVGEDLGIIMMLVNGTFMNTRLFRAAIFFIGMILLGAAFKILHLSGGDQLLICSFGGLFLVYVIHFIRKKSKNVLDVLKMILLFTFSVMPPLVLFHLVSRDAISTLALITRIPFIITFGLFLYQGYRNNFASKR